MANAIVLGLQWGDEGKGKIVDLLCPAFEVVVRYQGGHNAGHTVKFGDKHFALHLIPSGILHPGTRCVLGNSMVISPEAFFEELERLESLGVVAEGNLFVSDRAHVLLPVYAELDRAREETMGQGKIGTTARGIGPAYESKASRYGLRMCELGEARLEDRLQRLLRHLEPELEDLGVVLEVSPESLAADCREWEHRLRPYVRDTGALLRGWIADGDSLLFEGAQGTLLDLDHGTYPFVSSSSSTAGGTCTGSGVPPSSIDGAIGVLKAYTTRVGSGPFVSELDEATGKALRERGGEYGTTTGRPRRCGWLDLVAARYARAINGISTIALTKLDVLDRLEEIRVCVAYRIDGEERTDFPASLAELERAEPVYRAVPGWRRDTQGLLSYDELPPAARDYVALIEEELEAEVGLVSIGPRREETIVRPGGELARLTGDGLDDVLSQRLSG